MHCSHPVSKLTQCPCIDTDIETETKLHKDLNFSHVKFRRQLEPELQMKLLTGCIYPEIVSSVGFSGSEERAPRKPNFKLRFSHVYKNEFHSETGEQQRQD